MAYIILKRGREQRILAGHPWVYKSEIAIIKGDFADGDVVGIKDCKNRFLGEGFVNSASQIALRILTDRKETIDKEFFKNRIATAQKYRNEFVFDSNAKRIVFSEGDFLPGLIIDDYNGCIVLQTLTLGMDQRKDIITDSIKDVLNPNAIYQRNNVSVRKLEGLEEEKGFLYGSVNEYIVCDINGVKFYVNIEEGHKTGIYLDQRENYTAIKNLVNNKNILDCFCYTGGFSLHSARFGARNVLGIDISADIIETAKKNAVLNKVESICNWQVGNVFDILKEKSKNKEEYDIVILDPPSFTKTKDTVSSAYRGYKEINLRALQLIAEGGYLLTCCCSHHISRKIFMDIIIDAAKDAKRKLRLIKFLTQSKDHPILPAVPETEYLKCFILQVL